MSDKDIDLLIVFVCFFMLGFVLGMIFMEWLLGRIA